MNLPIEICAIIEDYLPIQFDCEAFEDLSNIASYYNGFNRESGRPREIDRRTLLTGFGSKTYPITFTWCIPGDYNQVRERKLFRVCLISQDTYRRIFRMRNAFAIEVFYLFDKNNIFCQHFSIESIE